MAKSVAGAGVTEKYYRRARLLALALAILLNAIWKAMGLSRRRQVVPSTIVDSWLRKAEDLIVEYRELSLSMAQDYIVDFMVADIPEVPLTPVGGQRAGWGAVDVEIKDDLDSMARVMLQGRVGAIPDAAEEVVSSQLEADPMDVEDLAELARVMGREWAERHTESGVDPLVVAPDQNPVNGQNVRNRLLYKGPKRFEKAAAKIDQLTRVVGDDSNEALLETKEIRTDKQAGRAFVSSTNAAVTLAEGGQDLVRAVTAANGLGYVRVLGPNPCAFCVMLAAQGIIYEEGAWDETNKRFRTFLSSAGNSMQGGSAKVHDGCQCRLEPVSMAGDNPQLPESVLRAKRLWEDATGRFEMWSWQDKVNLFRRAYSKGEVDRNIIEEAERDMLTTERDDLRLSIATLMVQLTHLEDYMARTGAEFGWEADWYREQIEYRLKRWKKRKYGETDWTREYQWALERVAAVFDPDSLKEDSAFMRKQARKQPELAKHLDKVRDYQEWAMAQAPDAWKHRSDYWASYQGPVVADEIMFADPVMPEFN